MIDAHAESRAVRHVDEPFVVEHDGRLDDVLMKVDGAFPTCHRGVVKPVEVCRWMLTARPMPVSSIPPDQTGMSCAAAYSAIRIDFDQAADPALLDVEDPAAPERDGVAASARSEDRLVEAERRHELLLQDRVPEDVAVRERLLDHHEVERVELAGGARRPRACSRRSRRPSAAASGNRSRTARTHSSRAPSRSSSSRGDSRVRDRVCTAVEQLGGDLLEADADAGQGLAGAGSRAARGAVALPAGR